MTKEKPDAASDIMPGPARTRRCHSRSLGAGWSLALPVCALKHFWISSSSFPSSSIKRSDAQLEGFRGGAELGWMPCQVHKDTGKMLVSFFVLSSWTGAGSVGTWLGSRCHVSLHSSLSGLPAWALRPLQPEFPLTAAQQLCRAFAHDFCLNQEKPLLCSSPQN